jgi:DNA (cytosine-5)-methyltransferase 1
VAQRRRRVFVVGYLGDWRPAAAVLFERHSLRRDLAPGRNKGEGTPTIIEEGFDSNGLQTTVGTLCADTHPGSYSGQDAYTGRLIPTVYETHPADSRVKPMGETCQTVTSRWGTGGGNVPLVQEAYSLREDAKANTFSATPLKVTPALQALRPSVQSHHAQTFIAAPELRVRRLTPKECERLQGFPDNFTDIPWRKKDTAPDGLRYKALGNSMAVPCMQWIGDGIDLVDKL